MVYQYQTRHSTEIAELATRMRNRYQEQAAPRNGSRMSYDPQPAEGKAASAVAKPP
jgi:hypothetical protein